MAALRPWLLAFFVIATLALTSLQGAIADQAPTESECRPYIEKALKQLETGDETPPDGDPGSSEESTVWNQVGEQGGTDDQQTHSAEEGEDSIEQGGAGAEGGASIEDGASSEEDGASAEEGGASAEGGASEQGETSAESVEGSVSLEGESAQDAASVEEEAQDAGSAEEGAESVEGSSEEKSGGESVEGGKSAEGESIEDGSSDEIGASVEEGKDSVEEGGASVEGDGSVEKGSEEGRASLEEGEDSGEEGGASSEEGRASVEEVGASVEKGNGSEEEGNGSEEGSGSVEGGASIEEGGPSAEEGEESVETGGHSAEEESASVEDGGASLEDGGASLEEGGSSVEEGASLEGGSSVEGGKEGVEEGGASLEEGGSSIEEGKGSVEEGGASLEEGGSSVEGKESVEEGAASVEEGTVSIEEGGASVEGGESVEEGGDSVEDKASVEEGSESVEEGGGSGEEGGASIEDSGESVEEGGESVQEEGEESVEGAASVEEGRASIEGSASVESGEIVKEGDESVEEVGVSVEEGGASVESVEDQISPTTTEEAAGRVESTEQADPPGIQEETIISTEAPVEGEAAPEDSGETSAEDTVAPDPEAEPTPEEELTLGLEIPEILRPREHISQILRLDAESVERELLLSKTVESTLKELKRLYDSAIKPLEILYKYRDLSNRHFGDPEIFSKPLVLFMGPWSGGKSSIINYLLDNEYKTTSLRTGAEPSPAYFNILMWGDREEVLDGTSLAADWTFSGLQKFGQGLLDRLRGLRLPSRLLEKVNIVEIPGILEIRKQVERLFPFNDACQWFIDRADIIFLVYDPAKLDVGPETEAILDQLKGREYQTRIILNKADQVRPEELMRVQGTLIWNISPLMSSQEPPVMYSASLWSLPYEIGAPLRLLQAQERAFLRDLRTAVDRRVENKIASARRFAVRVRNHAKMVDCYLTTYYNHKSFFGSRQKVSDDIVDRPQDYHIYEGLSTLTNISRYDLPDPDVYRDFFRLNPLYDFQQLSSTCTYFRGCPINRLDVAIAYDLPELVGKYRKSVDETLASVLAATQPKS